MDNNTFNNNNFGEFIPQKPFTEKSAVSEQSVSFAEQTNNSVPEQSDFSVEQENNPASEQSASYSEQDVFQKNEMEAQQVNSKHQNPVAAEQPQSFDAVNRNFMPEQSGCRAFEYQECVNNSANSAQPYRSMNNYNQYYQQQPVQQQMPQGYPQQPVQQVPQGYPQQPVQQVPQGYSQQPTQNIYNAQNNMNNGYQKPVEKNAYYGYDNPPHPDFPAPPFEQYPYAPYNAPTMPNMMPPSPPKKKANGGLIAIIIVLSALLLLSFGGLLIFMANNNGNNSNKSDNSGFSFNIPDNTNPNNSPYNYDDEDDMQSKTYDESDYSKKANPNFSGITLNSKPSDASTNKEYTATYASNKTAKSVVGILCYTEEVTDTSNASSVGSGIIVTSDGYVVTNSHVIGDSKNAYLIRIVTSDGKTYKAGVVGYDIRTDIAVLKMDDAKDLTPAVFGDSDKAEIGEDIVVIGNPGGLDFQNTTTKGVISATDREISQTSIVKYLQTDAPINPGNSGGPFVNYYGQVIGITTSKIVLEAYEGMGFAIPSNTAKSIIDSLIRNGYVSGRVKIGITGTAIDSATSKSDNIPEGIMIAEITKDGPCDNKGLKTDDIITEADGEKISSFSDIYKILEKHKAGDKIKLKYYRPTDKTYDEIEVTLQEDK